MTTDYSFVLTLADNGKKLKQVMWIGNEINQVLRRICKLQSCESNQKDCLIQSAVLSEIVLIFANRSKTSYMSYFI